jgi:uncharacterized membrane protein
VDVLGVLATWIHTIAFVIAWGYYGVLGRIVLPGLRHSVDPAALPSALGAIERRALPLVALSAVLFVVTGSYLLVVDSRYAGLGDFFANGWTSLMLVKHLLVVVLVGLAVAIDWCIREAEAAASDADRDRALRIVRFATEGATGLGALIVLVTAFAQAST